MTRFLLPLSLLMAVANAMKLHHPALQEFQRRRLDVQTGGGFGCVTSQDENRIECKMTFGEGEYDVAETCQTAGLEQDTLICNVCATNNGVMLKDGSQVEFCYDFECSISEMDETRGRDFSKSCNCIQATVNGEECAMCEFCNAKAKTYPSQFEDEVSLLTPPLALDCPHMEVVNSDCPLSTDDGMSGGGKFGVTLVVFSAIGLAGYIFIRRRRTRAASYASAAYDGGNTSIWGGGIHS